VAANHPEADARVAAADAALVDEHDRGVVARERVGDARAEKPCTDDDDVR
jgi:hypothetical protein